MSEVEKRPQDKALEEYSIAEARMLDAARRYSMGTLSVEELKVAAEFYGTAARASRKNS